MKMQYWLTRGLLLGFFCLLVQVSSAQTLSEVIALYQKNTGATTAKTRLSSMTVKGKTALGGMEFQTTVYRKAPGFFKVKVTLQGKYLINAYDGKVAWKINPFPGGSDKPEQMAGAEALSMQLDAPFDPEFINAAQKGHKVTLEGTQEIEGSMCYKLKVVRKDKQVKLFFLDKDSGVLIMTRGKSVHPMNPTVLITKETYQSNYKEVDGFMIAHYMEDRIDGKVVAKMQFDSITLNDKLDNNIFAFPKKQ